MSLGHIEILDWLREQGCPCNDSACEGMLTIINDAIEWARGQENPEEAEKECRNALRGGYYDLFRWLQKTQCPWMKSAAQSIGYEPDWIFGPGGELAD